MTERSFYEHPLAPEEFESRLRDMLADLDGPHGEEISSHIDWFLRRHPTPESRLAYARRKYLEAMQTIEGARFLTSE